MKKVSKVFDNLKKIIAEEGNQKFKCKICGQIHSGVFSPTVCQDCYSKGHR